MSHCKVSVTMTMFHTDADWVGIFSAVDVDAQPPNVLREIRMQSPINTFDCAVCAGQEFWAAGVVQMGDVL